MNRSALRIVRNKIGILKQAIELGNVFKADKMMGCHGIRFTASDRHEVAMISNEPPEKSRHKPSPRNRVESQIEEAELDFAIAYPVDGQVWVSNELRQATVFVQL